MWPPTSTFLDSWAPIFLNSCINRHFKGTKNSVPCCCNVALQLSVATYNILLSSMYPLSLILTVCGCVYYPNSISFLDYILLYEGNFLSLLFAGFSSLPFKKSCNEHTFHITQVNHLLVADYHPFYDFNFTHQCTFRCSIKPPSIQREIIIMHLILLAYMMKLY